MHSWVCCSVFALNIHTSARVHTRVHLSLQQFDGKKFYYKTRLLPRAIVNTLACQLCVRASSLCVFAWLIRCLSTPLSVMPARFRQQLNRLKTWLVSPTIIVYHGEMATPTHFTNDRNREYKVLLHSIQD